MILRDKCEMENILAILAINDVFSNIEKLNCGKKNLISLRKKRKSWITQIN